MTRNPSWLLISFVLVLAMATIQAGAPLPGQREPDRPWAVDHSCQWSPGPTLLAIVLRPGWEFWGSHLVPLGRVRRHRNPKRNRQRWQRRLARWARQRPAPTRPQRRRRQRQVLGQLLGLSNRPPLQPTFWKPGGVHKRSGSSEPSPAPDPLAELRQMRGWIDQVDEITLWDTLRRIRWIHGLCCPACGENDPQYLEVFDPDYRGGMCRYRCLVCALAGDPGEGGTFTDLTGTLFDGSRLDIRTLWLIIELFVAGRAAVETAREAGLNRHTVERYFRLLRGSIYLARSTEPIALAPEDIVEGDEVYITAGVKGCAGGLKLDRAPRKRSLKRRGRGKWESDRLPVLGLLCRGGQVRLFVLRNVQTATIRPIVHQMVAQGAQVYTDGYCIYHFLSREGYQHQSVNHSAGEYARGAVHCNSIEATWSWLRQMIRTYRGVSKVYLPLYVAQFEFFFNRRHHSRWSRTLDLLQVAFEADAATLLERVDGAQFAEVCPVAG